jgi:hypothetical protein
MAVESGTAKLQGRCHNNHLNHSSLDIAKREVLSTTHNFVEYIPAFGVANTRNIRAHMEGIETGETNQFQPPAPVPQPHLAPTARSLLRSSLRLHSGPWFSSAFPSSQHLPIQIVGPHRRRDDGDGVHLYRQIQYEDGSQHSKAVSSSQV